MSTPPDQKPPLPNEQKGFPQPKAPIRPPVPPARSAPASNQSPALPNQDPYRHYWAGPTVHPSAKDIKRSQRAQGALPRAPGPGNK